MHLYWAGCELSMDALQLRSRLSASFECHLKERGLFRRPGLLFSLGKLIFSLYERISTHNPLQVPFLR